MSNLQKWFTEYVTLMYPNSEEVEGKSERELDAMAHTARVRACWIVEKLIDTGAHRDLR